MSTLSFEVQKRVSRCNEKSYVVLSQTHFLMKKVRIFLNKTNPKCISWVKYSCKVISKIDTQRT